MEKLSVNVTGGPEITVREGEALELKPPVKVVIVGNIDAPLKWIEKKFSVPKVHENTEMFTQPVILVLDRLSHMTVDIDAGKIVLFEDEKNPYGAEITGKLVHHPDFLKWKINSGNPISSFELADFIKMNRSDFTSKEEAMKLVTELRNFRAKVDKKMEAFKDDRANFDIHKSQVVESNLPNDFTLLIPILKGEGKKSFKVEVNINPGDLSCSLISPEINDYLSDFKEQIIMDQVEKIQGIAPELCIVMV